MAALGALWSSAKGALWSWLGVWSSIAVTVIVYALVRSFDTFCSPDESDAKCRSKHAVLNCTVLMAGLWVAGKPHSAVVALFPVIFLPMMGVGGHHYKLEDHYFNKVNFILLGSFLLAFAIEEVGLHHRVALKLLSMVPGDPKMVLLAMMLISAALSAFMSNTATASLMCPLASSLYEEMKELNSERQERSDSDSQSTETDSESSDKTAERTEMAALDHMFKKMVLGVAYSCTIGGVSTKTGTGTNLAFTSIYGNLTGNTIGFGYWILFGLPISATMLCITWLLLLTLGGGLGSVARFPTSALRQRYAKLGATTRQELTVAAICLLTVLGWFFRAPAWGYGYSELFPDPDAFTDATVVLAATLPLFFIPGKEGGAILQWSKIQGKMPMGLFLLIGAGSAISHAFDESGLSLKIGDQMKNAADHLPLVLFQLACMIMAALMSQATSDVAVANILLPITYGVALSMEVDPLLLMLPVGLACSLPFMLVVSTPPNAIAFQTGFITQRDLLCFGGPLTLCGLFVTFAFCFLIAFKLLDIDGGA